MSRRGTKSWPELGFECWALGMEAGLVMGLRWNRLLAGGALAQREALRMAVEKAEAGATLGLALAALGAPAPAEAVGGATLRHYGKRVRANRRRLTRRRRS